MGTLHQSAELMRDARLRGYGIPAYDTFNYESTKMVFEAAARVRTPVIIMYYPSDYMPLHTFAQMVKDLGACYPVPFSLHLDHSPSFEICMKAIHEGFTSVMIDASQKPMAENIAETRKVVEAAHAMGIDVEGELGMVGRNEAVNRDRFTQPSEVKQFLEATGIDALAIAIGNSHGVYIEEPSLDIPLLKKIAGITQTPLVLHGTSMIPSQQLSEAVRHGITKTNIATEYLMRYVEEIGTLMQDPPKVIGALLEKAHAPMVDFIADKMKVLNPDDVKIL